MDGLREMAEWGVRQGKVYGVEDAIRIVGRFTRFDSDMYQALKQLRDKLREEVKEFEGRV